jgi:hypothetical protein
VANVRNRSRIVAIEVCLLFNFVVVSDFNIYFRYRHGSIYRNVLINRQNVENRSSFYVFYNAHCLLLY